MPKPTVPPCPYAPADHLEWNMFLKGVEGKAGLKDVMGRKMTRGLFWETYNHPSHAPKGILPTYTLREDPYFWYNAVCCPEGMWLPSARMIYVYSDNEYEAAIKLLGSWEHWKQVEGTDWFRTGEFRGKQILGFRGIDEWRQEQQDRLASLAEKVLVTQARDGNVAAAKALYTEAKKGKVGRPKKVVEVPAEDDSIAGDSARILALVQKQ